METATPLTFCSSFLAVRHYVERNRGHEAFQAMRAQLPDTVGVTLPPVITPGSWHPTIAFAGLLDLGAALFGTPDFYEDFGRAAAELEINIVYRVILRFTSPEWLLTQGSRIWRKAHNTGRWVIEGGPRRVRGSLYDFGLVHRGYCRSLVGWLTRSCEMTGAKGIRVLHPICRADGRECCVFEGRW